MRVNINKMMLSKKELFVMSKWRDSHSEIRLTRSMCDNFMNYFRNNIKKKCCVSRINRDFRCQSLKKKCVKFTINNRCRASFATHCMHRMRIRRRYDTRASRRTMKLNLHAAEHFYSNETIYHGKQKVALQYYETIAPQSKFYKFEYKYNCDCTQYDLLTQEKVKQMSKTSSCLEPPICTTFLKPYMLDTDVLEQLNLKEVVTELFLPYVFILPIFTNFSLPMKAMIDSVLSSNVQPLKNITVELRSEYEYQKKLFPHYGGVFQVNAFILSGGLIPKLLKQTNSYTDVDIYIENKSFDIISQRYLINMKDSSGIEIWFNNTKLSYITESAYMIKRVLSLNKNSFFYKLIKTQLREIFHPPQIIVYSRELYEDIDCLNTNTRGNNENLDKLVVDAYNIFNQFDIPMCRNALVFLYFEDYDYKHDPDFYKYPGTHIKYKILRDAGIIPEVFNQFYNDKIDVQFANKTTEEVAVFEKYYTKEQLEYYTCAPYAVAGISYQSGPYRPVFKDQLDELRNQRRQKYLSRCLLNINIDPIDDKKLKLNYNVPQLKLLAYNALC